MKKYGYGHAKGYFLQRDQDEAFTAGGGGATHGASIIMEDGSSYILLEDGSSSILKE